MASAVSPLIADISKWQGKPNFKLLKTAVNALIIRVQDGSSYEDPNHVYDEANAINYGIPFGEYAYGRFVSVNDAIIEAKDFLKRKSNDAKFLVLDVEDLTLKSCGIDRIGEASQAFIDTCKDAGYKTGFYVSHNLYKFYGLNHVKSDFLWLPRYGVNNGKPYTKPNWPSDLWQFTSKGRLSGINGDVDLSTTNGSKDLNWFLGIEPKKEEPKMPEGPFKDVEIGRWSEKAITNLKSKDIFNGDEKGNFNPTQPLTREQAAVVVDNLLRFFIKSLGGKE